MADINFLPYTLSGMGELADAQLSNGQIEILGKQRAGIPAVDAVSTYFRTRFNQEDEDGRGTMPRLIEAPLEAVVREYCRSIWEDVLTDHSLQTGIMTVARNGVERVATAPAVYTIPQYLGANAPRDESNAHYQFPFMVVNSS